MLDLYKARRPSDAAEIVRGRDACLRLNGRIHRQQAETAFGRMWSTSFDYPPARRQDGTLEAVALSAKDGTLECIVQVRVRMGGS